MDRVADGTDMKYVSYITSLKLNPECVYVFGLAELGALTLVGPNFEALGR
jgi:hypothetical protein